MFPIRDDNPQLVTPVVTYAIIALNVAAWVFLQGLGEPAALVRSVCNFGLIPAGLLQSLPDGSGIRMGEGYACMVPSAPAWDTAITSMFMHGGWFHLIGNMWFLWVFGDNVEDSMGRVRFALFYLLCGLAAAALQVASNPDSAIPMVGASGAIGGVMGAYIVLYPRVSVHMLVVLGFFFTRVAVPAIFMLGYWLLIQVLGGFVSFGQEGGGTAFWAHVGGFAAGAAAIMLFRDEELLARHPYYGWQRRSPTRNFKRMSY